MITCSMRTNQFNAEVQANSFLARIVTLLRNTLVLRLIVDQNGNIGVIASMEPVWDDTKPNFTH